MTRKITFISIYLIFFFVGDALFSNFIYKRDINHNCYKYLSNFYFFKKNCYAKEKWVKGVKSYEVYTDENGFRFSGKKINYNETTKTAVFFGDSFTYGMGLNYKKTFVGLLENKQKKFKILNLELIIFNASSALISLNSTFSKITSIFENQFSS